MLLGRDELYHHYRFNTGCSQDGGSTGNRTQIVHLSSAKPGYKAGALPLSYTSNDWYPESASNRHTASFKPARVSI